MNVTIVGLGEDKMEELKRAIQAVSETTGLVMGERRVIQLIISNGASMAAIGTRIHEQLFEAMSRYEEEVLKTTLGIHEDLGTTTISIDDLKVLPFKYPFEEEDKRDIHFKPFAQFINQPIGKRRRRK